MNYKLAKVGLHFICSLMRFDAEKFWLTFISSALLYTQAILKLIYWCK